MSKVGDSGGGMYTVSILGNSFDLVLLSYTPSIYADGYIVFAFPFVCSLVRSLVLHGICVKVLR